MAVLPIVHQAFRHKVFCCLLIVGIRIGEPDIPVPMGNENIVEALYVRFLIHAVPFVWDLVLVEL